MSTKLYSGLRLKDSSRELYAVTPELRAALLPRFREASKRLVAREIAELTDNRQHRATADPNQSPFFEAEEKWLQRQHSLGDHHSLNDPLRFSMIFGRSSGGQVLAYPFYTESSYREALEATELFEDYHYQDNSDRPEELSAQEWRRRAQEWESITNEDGTFSHLPLWELSGTRRPFGELFFSSEPIDLNRYSDLQSRTARFLELELFRFLVQREGQRDQQKLTGIYFAVQRALRELWSNHSSEIRLLEPLPEGLSFEYSRLKPLPEVSYGLKELFLEIYHRENSSKA